MKLTKREKILVAIASKSAKKRSYRGRYYGRRKRY